MMPDISPESPLYKVQEFMRLYGEVHRAMYEFRQTILLPLDFNDAEALATRWFRLCALSDVYAEKGRAWSQALNAEFPFGWSRVGELHHRLTREPIDDFRARVGTIKYAPDGETLESLTYIYDWEFPAPLDLLRCARYAWSLHRSDERERLALAVAGWAASRIQWGNRLRRRSSGQLKAKTKARARHWQKDRSMDDLLPEVFDLLENYPGPPLGRVRVARTEAEVETQKAYFLGPVAKASRAWCKGFINELHRRLDRAAYKRYKGNFVTDEEIRLNDEPSDDPIVPTLLREAPLDPLEVILAKAEAAPLQEILSPREWEALVLKVDGHSLRSISQSLGLTDREILNALARVRYLDPSVRKKKQQSRKAPPKKNP